MTPLYDKITQALKRHADQEAADIKLFVALIGELEPQHRDPKYRVDSNSRHNSATVTMIAGAAVCDVEVENGKINILTPDRSSAVTVGTIDEATTEVADRIAVALRMQKRRLHTMQAAYG